MELPEGRGLSAELVDGKPEELHQAIQKRLELSVGPVVWASTHDGFARMEHHVQHGYFRLHHPPRQLLHIVE
jgi:hypothetical protein